MQALRHCARAAGVAWLCLPMAIGALAPADADAKQARNKSVLRAFVKYEACPATGLRRLPCPGWQIDHILALCAGGRDAVENLQWLTREAHREKTRVDVRWCRFLRNGANRGSTRQPVPIQSR